jgi:hypothetical protein
MAKNLVKEKKVILIDDDLKIIEYIYAYIDGVDAGSDREPPAPKERGWEVIHVQRKRVKSKYGHIWTTRYVFAKK